ncbi:H-NS family nucleoid-associated regulatory protein [Paraburkholderia sp. J10-1]|uniref:H-NS family nucleoid-associated regulatory protein n=1 Tax=Paraburkholderia sp. J10-1 TaxID=2805430 RepID=UPI002AB65551|nr:H-NS family nucleoid-associated regulatory protein [Paraburkholderia sp. J10-1]
MATLEGIQARIAKLQAQAEALVTTKSSAVLEKIRDLMDKHGISVADIESDAGKRRGRKPLAKSVASKAASSAKYADPKTGATWSGRGRAPAWIASVKDRTKFLVGGNASSAKPADKVKAANYVRGVQPPMYRNPKTNETWSGRGRAPAWLAGSKDRSKFLIAVVAEPAAAPKVKAAKVVTAKKPVTKKAAVSKNEAPAAKKAAAKTPAASARKTASKVGATAKAPVARKARAAKNAVKATAPADATVNQAPTEVASTPAAA